MISEITDGTFQEETWEGLVLTDFWATWCGPCRTQAPILEQLAQDYDETEIKITKLNIDENMDTPVKFGIMSIPTLLLQKNGEVLEKLVGVHSKEQLKEVIEKYL
ncbi:MAG: thioredoxin [Lactobacillales bacterium]|jgi:thioredoxin 1|nr:thioredoxin [Lactobacillales bacterium]